MLEGEGFDKDERRPIFSCVLFVCNSGLVDTMEAKVVNVKLPHW